MTWRLAIGCCMLALQVKSQHIAEFVSQQAGYQTQGLVLPPTHTFQYIARTGDTLSDGSLLSGNPDFTAFVPRFGSSTQGYISINHENSGLNGGVTVFDARYSPFDRLWNIQNGLPIDFSSMLGISRPCSGTVTPWNTVILGEESLLTSDLDSNGYYDGGWLVEFDPATRIPLRKLYKAGNTKHENCAIAKNLRVLYTAGDDPNYGYLFKLVTDEKRDFSTGRLFVLVRDSANASTGYWLRVPNNTPQECNTVNAFANLHQAWNFAGVEDVEIGPGGCVYFSAKYSGRVWRFRDADSLVTDLEVFVENKAYPLHTATGVQMAQWGVGADNMAFDDQGNLWVLQDGGDNHVWMVGAGHTDKKPQIALFATTPYGSEPTGITFTPDFRFMFITFQHPSGMNGDTLTDAAGRQVVFNTPTSVIIARKEWLGPGWPADTVPQIQVSVSPNPGSGAELWVHSDAIQDGLGWIMIRVYDAEGRLLHHRQYSSEAPVRLDFRPEADGVYFLKAECSNWTAQTRFVVCRGRF